MDTETMLRIGAVTVGAAILVSNLVSWEKITAFLFSLLEKKEAPVIPVVPVMPEDGDEQFLKIVDLWFQLRNECEEYGLPKAITAIDKVFPLLNDKIEGAE